MKENNPETLFQKLQDEKLNSLKEEYLNFEKGYLSKKVAVDDYILIAKKQELSLTEIVINNTLYFDDFKREIESKMIYSYERYANPISYMLKEFMPDILKKYKERKEWNILKKQEGRFDYEYFDNFKEEDAIKLFAHIKAFNEFNIFLLERYTVLEEEEDNNLGRTLKPKIRERINFRKNNSKPFIKELHKLLFNHNLISADYNEFSIHFFETGDFPKIQWYGIEVELVQLFKDIPISNKYIFITIANHFCKKNGENFKNKQLSSAFHNQITTQLQMEEIIKKLRAF